MNAANNLTYTCEAFTLNNQKEEKLKIIEVHSYNKIYYKNPISLLNAYGLILLAYIDYIGNNTEKTVDFLDFIKYSVKNSHLSDTLTKVEFSIKDGIISIKDNSDYGNLGEFYIDNYKCNVCHSYIFIEHIISNEKYLYYTD